jgi:hypothetical protein
VDEDQDQAEESDWGKVPAIAHAFPLWMARLSLCLKKREERESPVQEANLAPKSRLRSRADWPQVPSDSIAMGMNKMSLRAVNSAYFAILFRSAWAAAEPATMAD